MNLVDAQQHKICRFVTERSYEKIFMFVKSHENFENVANEERSVDTDSKSAEFQINTSENIEREKKDVQKEK